MIFFVFGTLQPFLAEHPEVLRPGRQAPDPQRAKTAIPASPSAPQPTSIRQGRAPAAAAYSALAGSARPDLPKPCTSLSSSAPLLSAGAARIPAFGKNARDGQAAKKSMPSVYFKASDIAINSPPKYSKIS